MDRLRDGKDGSASARLLAQVPRTEVSSVSKARVWAKLRRREGAGRGALGLRFAVVAVLLCGSFAFAADRLSLLGSLSPSRLFGAQEHGATGPSGAAPTVPVRPSLPAPPVVEVAPAPTAPPPEASVAPPASEPSARPASPASPVGLARAAVVAPSTPPSSAPSAAAVPPPVDQETDLVLDGLRALRREHDPARARTLFARYLSRHPGGPLAEDALGYSMEAADAQGAPGEAARLADAYLRAYPAGRYGALAERLKIVPSP